MTFFDDLARWESGDLSRDGLLARHPANDASDMAMILDLHERLSMMTVEPVPYRDSEWERLRNALPERNLLPERNSLSERIARKRSRVSQLIARPLVAASMVVGLSGAAAAASPAVREQMLTTWHRIERTIGGGNDHPATPLAPSASPTDRPTPSATQSPAGDNDPSTGGTAGNSGGNSNESGDNGTGNGTNSGGDNPSGDNPGG
ncbi:MAG: hypothetical protein ACXWDU_10820, partial [Actinomycetota bacterium]